MSSLELPSLTFAQGEPPASPASDDGWEARFDHHGRVCAYTRVVDGCGWLFMPGFAHFRFSTSGTEVEAFPQPDVPAEKITEAYHRVALPLALQTAGYEVLHASAVSHVGGVHVFCGASHAGKSTLAYALGRRGFEVWADDAVAFKADATAITSVPLPFALRLRREVADFFQEPAHHGSSPNGKTEALRHRAAGSRAIASVSLLERGSDSTISRLSSAESLPAVLYHSFYFSLDDPSVRHRMTNQFLDLIARVPVFRISVRPGLGGVALLLDELEQRVLRATAAPEQKRARPRALPQTM